MTALMGSTARYMFTVTWSPEDEEFVATCLEFPSLSWLAGTPEDALAGLRELVDEVVADLRESGESVGGRRCAAGTESRRTPVECARRPARGREE